MTGIEPVDLFLTKEALYRLSYMGSNQPGRPADPSAGWSGRRDSNSRHPAWKAGALPAELHPHLNRPTGPPRPACRASDPRGTSTHAGSPVVTIDLGSRNLLHKTLL